jgi:hypothetical protein
MAGPVLIVDRFCSRNQDRWLAEIRQTERSQFAMELEIARAYWKKFPDLVEAENFPEWLVGDYARECGKAPENLSSDLILPGSKEFEDHCREVLTEEVARQRSVTGR